VFEGKVVRFNIVLSEMCGEILVKFFAKLFYKKAGFGYFYKSNNNQQKLSLFVFRGEFPKGNSLF